MLDYGYHGDNLVVKGSGKSPETIKGRIPPNLVGVRQPRSVARRGGVLSGGGGGGSVGIGLIALEKLGLPNRRSEPLDIYITHGLEIKCFGPQIPLVCGLNRPWLSLIKGLEKCFGPPNHMFLVKLTLFLVPPYPGPR